MTSEYSGMLLLTFPIFFGEPYRFLFKDFVIKEGLELVPQQAKEGEKQQKVKKKWRVEERCKQTKDKLIAMIKIGRQTYQR